MAATWGQFLSQYGEEPNPAWVEALARFTDDEIMQGYYRARDAGSEFPPNLSVFVGHVANKSDTTSVQQARQSQSPDEALLPGPDLGEGCALPPPTNGPQSGADFFSEMRGLFND